MVKLPTMLELLAITPPNELREIAAVRGIPVADGATKGDLIYTLADRLLEPASLRKAIDSLTLHERIAWNALVEAGGRLEGSGFRAHFGSVRREDPNATGKKKVAAARPPGVVYPGERLERLGLAFQSALPHYSTSIPSEVMQAAGSLLPIPADPPAPVAAPAAYSPACDITGALVVYLSYCRSRRVSLTAEGELHSRHLSALERNLWPQFQMVGGRFAEYGYDFLACVRHLLSRLRLVEVGDRELTGTARAETWLASPRRDLIADAWAAFFRDEEQTEFRTIRRPDGTTGPEVTSLRTALLDCLSRCSTGEWIATDDLVEYVYKRHPGYFRPWKDPVSYYWWNEARDELPVAAGWPADTKGSIARWLCNGLRWLGLVDTATAAEAVRLTSLGAFLLGKSATWEDEPQSRPFVVQPNFEVVVPAEAAPLTVYRLDRVADHVSRDRVSIYTITQASIRRAMESGLGPDAPLTFLTEGAGKELPQNVSFSVRGWADRYGEIDIRHMTVLQTAREDLVTELGSSPKLKLNLGERLGPRAVAVANDDLPALIARLRKAGYSPKAGPQVETPGAVSAQSVTLPESELVVLVAAAAALREIGGSDAVSAFVIDNVRRHLSPWADRQVDDLARSIRLVLAVRGKRVHHRGDQPAARFARAHTEPALRQAISERRPVTMEYYDGDANEFSVEVIYPKRIEGVQGNDVLYGEKVHGGHVVAYFMDHIRTVRPGASTPVAPEAED